MTALGGEEDFVSVMDDGSTAGYALSYVDDFIVTAPRPTAERFLKKLSTMWKCAEPKWVTQHQWLKFCGIEMRWKDDELLVGQPDYNTREIVSYILIFNLVKFPSRSWMMWTWRTEFFRKM